MGATSIIGSIGDSVSEIIAAAQPANTTPAPLSGAPVAPAASPKAPTWIWVAGAILVGVVLYTLAKRR